MFGTVGEILGLQCCGQFLRRTTAFFLEFALSLWLLFESTGWMYQHQLCMCLVTKEFLWRCCRASDEHFFQWFVVWELVIFFDGNFDAYLLGSG